MPASSSPIVAYNKDPDAVSDYTFNWANWLGDDQIVTSTWTVPAGVNNVGATNSTSTSTIWLSGGVAGTAYSVYCEITTVGGRTDKRTMKINVLDR